MNLLSNSIFNPDLLAYAYLYGPYNFNKSPMVISGTLVIVHGKPVNHTLWGYDGWPGWCISLSLDHFRCMKCYMPTTGIVRINNKLKYTPKTFTFPKKNNEYYLHHGIGDIITMMQEPPNKPTILFYGYALKKANSQISSIFQWSTSQPHLKLLPLPLMLLQIQTQYPSLPIITHQYTPAPRVEPVVQSTKVQTLTT